MSELACSGAALAKVVTLTAKSPEPSVRYARRFADQITSSFYEACRIGNLDAARQLMEALDWEIARSMVLFPADARFDGDDVAAVYARYEIEVSRREQT